MTTLRVAGFAAEKTYRKNSPSISFDKRDYAALVPISFILQNLQQITRFQFHIPAQGIEAEILFAFSKKIGADSPVFAGTPAKMRPNWVFYAKNQPAGTFKPCYPTPSFVPSKPDAMSVGNILQIADYGFQISDFGRMFDISRLTLLSALDGIFQPEYSEIRNLKSEIHFTRRKLW